MNKCKPFPLFGTNSGWKPTIIPQPIMLPHFQRNNYSLSLEITPSFVFKPSFSYKFNNHGSPSTPCLDQSSPPQTQGYRSWVCDYTVGFGLKTSFEKPKIDDFEFGIEKKLNNLGFFSIKMKTNKKIETIISKQYNKNIEIVGIYNYNKSHLGTIGTKIRVTDNLPTIPLNGDMYVSLQIDTNGSSQISNSIILHKLYDLGFTSWCGYQNNEFRYGFCLNLP